MTQMLKCAMYSALGTFSVGIIPVVFNLVNQYNEASLEFEKLKMESEKMKKEYLDKCLKDTANKPKSAFLIYVDEIQKTHPEETATDILQKRWMKLKKEDKAKYFIMEKSQKALQELREEQRQAQLTEEQPTASFQCELLINQIRRTSLTPRIDMTSSEDVIVLQLRPLRGEFR